MRVAEDATTQEAWASAAMVRSNVGKCQRNEITNTLWSLGEKLNFPKFGVSWREVA